MPKRIDLTRQQFGDLTVIKLSNKTYNRLRLWECHCICDEIIYASTSSLKSGHYKSCGCQQTTRRSQSVSDYAQSQIIDKTRQSVLKAKVYKTNKSGYKGINWDNKRAKWRVSIGINKKQIHVGYFDNLDDAILARKDAEEQYHKPYFT